MAATAGAAATVASFVGWRTIRRLRLAAAERRHAELAGEHSVATGVGTVVDRLRLIGVLLDDRRDDSAVRRLCESWRTDLGRRARASATYLGDVLLQHERQRRELPDLSAHVRFHVSTGDGCTLLTRRQVAALRRALTDLDPRGDVPVARCDPYAGRRGRLRLAVGERVVLLDGSNPTGGTGAAFEHGRRRVLDLAGDAAAEARTLLSQRRTTLGDRRARQVEAALREVERWLARERSSSTTTS